MADPDGGLVVVGSGSVRSPFLIGLETLPADQPLSAAMITALLAKSDLSWVTDQLALKATTTSVAAKLTKAGDTYPEASDFVLGTTTGTRLGTAAAQKLGFFGATPVVQQSATTGLGVLLSNLGLRAAGTAFPLTTSGAVSLTGALQEGLTARTGAVTLTAGTSVPFNPCDATSGAFAVTLAATAVAGHLFTIKKTDTSTNAVTVTPTSGTIDGAATYVLSLPGQSVTVMSTTVSGAWVVIATTDGDTGWVSPTTNTPAANWTVTTCAARRIGSRVQLYVQCSRTTSAITNSTTGDVANTALLTLTDARFIPTTILAAAPAALSSGTAGRVAQGSIGNTGIVTLGAVGGTIDVAIGETISLGGSYLV